MDNSPLFNLLMQKQLAGTQAQPSSPGMPTVGGPTPAPTAPLWKNFLQQPASPQPGPAGQPPTGGLPPSVAPLGSTTPSPVMKGPLTPSLNGNSTTLPNSPVPPSPTAKVPPAARRWDNANKIADAYANGWNPNPILLRAQLGHK